VLVQFDPPRSPKSARPSAMAQVLQN